MKKIFSIFILLSILLIFASCGTLLTYNYSFPKDIYSYDKLFDAVLFDLNMRGIRALNTEKSVGLIHTETEELLLTQTNTDIIYSRTAKFIPPSESSLTLDMAWSKYNDTIINDISQKYFQINAR
jgi:hypothetical protein